MAATPIVPNGQQNRGHQVNPVVDIMLPTVITAALTIPALIAAQYSPWFRLAFTGYMLEIAATAGAAYRLASGHGIALSGAVRSCVAVLWGQQSQDSSDTPDMSHQQTV